MMKKVITLSAQHDTNKATASSWLASLNTETLIMHHVISLFKCKNN